MLTLRASGMSRIMKCLGPINLLNLPEDESGPAAEEGTAAGELLRAMLEQRTLTPDVPSHASNGVRFDSDMWFYLKPIAHEILSRAESVILCETEVVIPSPHPGIQIVGHSDAVFEAEGKLYVDDLKYGWKLVEVKENWQLLCYAVGEILRRQKVFSRIVLRIHQPRPHHEDGETRTWELSYEELFTYYQRLQERLGQIASGHRELVTGPHCQYCPAAAKDCPAFNRSYYAALDYVLGEFKQDSLDEASVALQLSQLQKAREILKIKWDSLEDYAVDHIKKGGLLSGWMTEAKKGHRRWKNMVTPQSLKALTGKDVLREELLSPAQVEKMGVPKEVINLFTEQAFLGMKLVQKDAGAMADKIFGTPQKL